MELARAISDRKRENWCSRSKETVHDVDVVTLEPNGDVDFSDRPKDDRKKKRKKSRSRLGSEGRSRKKDTPARDVGYTSYPWDEERSHFSVVISSSTFFTEDDLGNRVELPPQDPKSSRKLESTSSAGNASADSRFQGRVICSGSDAQSPGRAIS